MVKILISVKWRLYFICDFDFFVLYYIFIDFVINMVLGKVKSLIISFDCFNDSNVFVYFSGDIVLGRVNLEVIGEIRVKFFKIYVRGYVKVCWIEFWNVGFNIVYI